MATIHFFDADYAEKYGVLESVFIQNFIHWIAHNKANNKHYIDGRTWSYNSVKAFQEIYFYLSPKQITRVLNSLKKQEVIQTAKHNKNPYDHTLWYAFIDELSFLPNGKFEETKQEIRIDETDKSYTDNITNSIPNKSIYSFESFRADYGALSGCSEATAKKWFNKLTNKQLEILPLKVKQYLKFLSLQPWRSKVNAGTFLNAKSDKMNFTVDLLEMIEKLKQVESNANISVTTTPRRAYNRTISKQKDYLDIDSLVNSKKVS